MLPYKTFFAAVRYESQGKIYWVQLNILLLFYNGDDLRIIFYL